MEEYEYIIVGGGPSGLTCAHMLTRLHKNVLVIEREDVLGGNHRVKRVEDKFTHHSPMVYTTAAKNFMRILNQINFNFEEHYTPYNFSIFTVFNEQLRDKLSMKEFLAFAKDFFIFVFDEKYLNDVSVYDYCKKYKFSEETIDVLDRICRLSDGGDAKRYSVNSLFELLNQNIFYKLYQPKKTNDVGLFKAWEDFLLKRNTDIVLGHEIKEINYNDKIIDKKYKYKKLLLCIPPENIIQLTQEKIPRNISYNIYVSVTFHYDSFFNIEKHHGFSLTPWGIFWIVMTDYTDDIKNQGVIISVTASITDVKSEFTNKTLNETNDEEEVKQEIFRQLNLNFDEKIPMYKDAIINPNNYYEDGWKCKDSSFLDIPDPVYIDYESNFEDVYYIGAFNGMTYYKPTSIEKAITNSMNSLLLIEPSLGKYFKVRKGFYLDKMIKIILFIIIIIVVIIIVTV